MNAMLNVSSRRVCVIDVGTNSTRYTIADIDRERHRITILFQGSKITRLGAGITDATILPDHAQKTLEVIQRFYDHALSLAVSDFKIVGTAILREAKNGEAFCQKVEGYAGVPLRVLDGCTEGHLAETAIAHSLSLTDKGFIGVDIGGGSIQIMVHNSGQPSLYESLPLGAVRLTKTFLPSDPPTGVQMQALGDHLSAALEPVIAKMQLPSAHILVGVGGTITTASAMIQALKVYDHAKIHGSKLEATQWKALLHKICRLPALARLKLPGLEKGREDILPAGLLALDALACALGKETITVSNRGLLYGLLLEYVA
jgi:exopolyphosphatase / guanosine-5'-triphosphate,3'-diphosphate pyrophosphatase